MTPDHCPICPRIRRNERPLCNRHMQRSGGALVKRWFALSARVRKGGGPLPANDRDRLNALELAMTNNAIHYDAIRETGRHPVWVPTRDTWIDPRAHAVTVLTEWVAKHQFGRDAGNDRAIIERIASDLFPPEEGH